MKTLMATDGSDEATTALLTATRLLRRRDNEVHVVCVAPEFYESGSQKNDERVRDEYQRRIARETKTILERAHKTLLAEGVTAKTRAETGSPSKVIVRLADDYNVTVLGATSQYDTTRPGIGSVASRVVEHAPGIVLVCRELGGGSNLRILLCVDSSRASQQALSALTTYLNTESAEITLMHVVETPWVNLGLDRDWFDQGGETREQRSSEIQLEEELQSEANEIIEDAAEQLTRHGLDVTTVIAEGNPATEILKWASPHLLVLKRFFSLLGGSLSLCSGQRQPRASEGHGTNDSVECARPIAGEGASVRDHDEIASCLLSMVGRGGLRGRARA